MARNKRRRSGIDWHGILEEHDNALRLLEQLRQLEAGVRSFPPTENPAHEEWRREVLETIAKLKACYAHHEAAEQRMTTLCAQAGFKGIAN